MTRHTVKELAAALSAKAEGDLSVVVTGVAEPADASSGDLAVAMTPEFLNDISKGAAVAAIVQTGTQWQATDLKAVILVDRPRLAMAGLTDVLTQSGFGAAGIDPSAIIDPSARIGKNSFIGPYAVIGKGAQVGRNAMIGAHVSIADGAIIGRDAVLQPGVRIGRNVRIGDRFCAHSGVVIGGDGFSFVTPEPSAVEKVRETLGDGDGQTDEAQKWLKIHSLGGIEIGDDVEIGANSSVDAGTIRATSIGDGTKIDALVQVGHNVRIGANCLLCAHVAVGGSAKLGNNVVLGGQVGVADNITLGDQVVAGGASKILSNVPKGRAILGYPAVKMSSHIQNYKALRRLPRLLRDFEKLQKSVSKKRDID